MSGFIGTMPMRSLLTARQYRPKDPSQTVEFSIAHPRHLFPELYEEVREKSLFGLFSKPVKRVRKDHVVQDAFAAFIAAQLITETSAFGDFKYHHSGTGVGDEAASDGALGTPVEDARVVGTQVQGAGGTKTYKSVGTITYTDTRAITEHGLFNGAGSGGPPVTGDTMMDRSKFAAINVVSGNQIEFTYELAIASGG